MEQKTIRDSRTRRCCATRGLVALTLLLFSFAAPFGNSMARAEGELRGVEDDVANFLFFPGVGNVDQAVASLDDGRV